MTDQAEMVTEALGDHVIHLYRCHLIDGYLHKRGKRFSIGLREAAAKFAPSRDQVARQNVIAARKGDYLGMLSTGGQQRNFLLKNRTPDGNIRWLLRRNPHLSTQISEIYLVDEVTIMRNTMDLPSEGTSNE